MFQIDTCQHSAHICHQMGRPDYGGSRSFYLGVDLAPYFIHFGLKCHLQYTAPQIAARIDERRHFVDRGERSPSIGLTGTVERETHANIMAGIFVTPFGKPVELGARRHDGRRPKIPTRCD